MRLSKYEKETIILTSEGDDTVQIYTFNASLKRRLAEYAKKYPHLARLDSWTAEGSAMFWINPECLFVCCRHFQRKDGKFSVSVVKNTA